MGLNELGQQLHDRKTRGEILSTEEQTQLESWYAALDRVEADDLGLTGTTKTEASLRAQIDSALAQIAAVTRRIQELGEENEALRREITALHRGSFDCFPDWHYDITRVVHVLYPQGGCHYAEEVDHYHRQPGI